jgi:hypothetical protein
VGLVWDLHAPPRHVRDDEEPPAQQAA